MRPPAVRGPRQSANPALPSATTRSRLVRAAGRGSVGWLGLRTPHRASGSRPRRGRRRRGPHPANAGGHGSQCQPRGHRPLPRTSLEPCCDRGNWRRGDRTRLGRPETHVPGRVGGPRRGGRLILARRWPRSRAPGRLVLRVVRRVGRSGNEAGGVPPPCRTATGGDSSARRAARRGCRSTISFSSRSRGAVVVGTAVALEARRPLGRFKHPAPPPVAACRTRLEPPAARPARRAATRRRVRRPVRDRAGAVSGGCGRRGS